jgi:hypothetical protein
MVVALVDHASVASGEVDGGVKTGRAAKVERGRCLQFLVDSPECRRAIDSQGVADADVPVWAPPDHQYVIRRGDVHSASGEPLGSPTT